MQFPDMRIGNQRTAAQLFIEERMGVLQGRVAPAWEKDYEALVTAMLRNS
jgi:hypothetical protein